MPRAATVLRSASSPVLIAFSPPPKKLFASLVPPTAERSTTRWSAGALSMAASHRFAPPLSAHMMIASLVLSAAAISLLVVISLARLSVSTPCAAYCSPYIHFRAISRSRSETLAMNDAEYPSRAACFAARRPTTLLSPENDDACGWRNHECERQDSLVSR